MNWLDLAAGLVLGGLASALFFAGFRLGIRIAIRAPRPGPLLLLSAAVRIALLLLAGFAAASIGVWSLAGFAAAFLAVRFAILTRARSTTVKESF
jgi:hypothetical protein